MHPQIKNIFQNLDQFMNTNESDFYSEIINQAYYEHLNPKIFISDDFSKIFRKKSYNMLEIMDFEGTVINSIKFPGFLVDIDKKNDQLYILGSYKKGNYVCTLSENQTTKTKQIYSEEVNLLEDSRFLHRLNYFKNNTIITYSPFHYSFHSVY